MLVMGAALVLLGTACATIQDRATMDSIMLDKPVHFVAPDGNEIIAAPDTYRIEALDDRALRFIPSEQNTVPCIFRFVARCCHA
jgi:hypothetical protein